MSRNAKQCGYLTTKPQIYMSGAEGGKMAESSSTYTMYLAYCGCFQYLRYCR